MYENWPTKIETTLISAYIIEDVMKSFHFQKIDGVYKKNWYYSFYGLFWSR